MPVSVPLLSQKHLLIKKDGTLDGAVGPSKEKKLLLNQKL